MKLVRCVRNYIDNDPSRFHTPGHKGAKGACGIVGFEWDITELPGIGSLYDGNGPIRDAEREAALCYGAEDSFFSAGGATLCIQTMLYLSGAKKIIAGRGAHQSAVYAMAQCGIIPVWLWPDCEAGIDLPGRYRAQDVRKLLTQNPDAGAVYITSPDYFGCLSDISEISGVCREFGVQLLVDNAHGSHLCLFEGLHPIRQGADWCCDSAHKTLPVLTGGALLHTNHRGMVSRVKAAMALFGSTSPSFMTLCSLDACTEYLERRGRNDFLSVAETVSQLRRTAVGRGFSLPDGPTDPVRLTLYSRAGDKRMISHFEDYSVSMEYQSGGWSVFLPSPFNSIRDYERLSEAVDAWREPPGLRPRDSEVLKPEAVMSPRQALFSPFETIPVRESLGRVCAGYTVSCPPGIPLIMPGERICEKIINFLTSVGTTAINVVK